MNAILTDSQEVTIKWFISFNFGDYAMNCSHYLHISTYQILNQLPTILHDYYETNI